MIDLETLNKFDTSKNVCKVYDQMGMKLPKIHYDLQNLFQQIDFKNIDQYSICWNGRIWCFRRYF